jgi:hypothetical protein
VSRTGSGADADRFDPHRELPPEPDANTERPNWGRYPIVFGEGAG